MVAASAADRAATAPTGAARLDVALGATVDLAHASGILGRPDAAWLGQRVAAGPDGIRRFGCDLELAVGPDARTVFRKAAIVGLGSPQWDRDALIVPIEWFAATFAPLFPIFVGQLRLTSTWIGLRGIYVPPGGGVGFVLDRALLGIAARGTGRWFLAKVASALR